MDAGVKDSFERQTRTVVEVSVRSTVTALERDGTAAATLPQILQDMGGELTDKITQLYRDSSSKLLQENRALRAEVAQLEAELKSNIAAGFQLRSQVGRLRREVVHLDLDLKRMRERSEESRELLERERRKRTLSGPVHVLLQSGSMLGDTEGGFNIIRKLL